MKVDARVATTEELTTVHTETHVALMQEVSSRAYGKHGRKKLEGRYSSVYFNSGSSESALLAAGSVIEVGSSPRHRCFNLNSAIEYFRDNL